MTQSDRFDVLTQSIDGFHAIEASAGTGKTYSITLLWLRLLLEQRVGVEQILVTTFTRAATAELRERLLVTLRKALLAAKRDPTSPDEAESQIVARLRNQAPARPLVDELEAALSSFDLAPIHTIHGFCQSLISRHTLELGCDPSLELTENADDILAEIVGDELMRRAEHELLDPDDALAAARATVNNPLARILEPIAVGDARAQLESLVDPLLRQVERLPLPSKSGLSIKGKLESARDLGSREKLSVAQQRMLGPLQGDIEQALNEAYALHRALRAAELYPIAAWAREQFTQRKLQAKVRTFDDILLTVYRALGTFEGRQGPLARAIRARFRAAIVDECQDSDSVQIGVFQKLFTTSTPFLVIGDPKQSIYRFRGADLSSYRNLASGAEKAPSMTTNYRSDLPLVQALNRLYRSQPYFGGGTPDDPIRYIEVSAAAEQGRIDDVHAKEPLLLLWSDCVDRSAAKRDLARQLAVEFRRLLTEPVRIVDRERKKLRCVRADDLAVLATSHADLLIVRRELQAQGIPCEQAGTSLGSVWKSDEALDIHAWLVAAAALEEHADPLTALLAFAATPLLGLAPTAILELKESPALQAALAQQLLLDGAALRFQGPLPLLQRYWADAERMRQRLRHRDGERRLTNWRHVGCLLQEEWSHGRWRAADLALWLSRKRGQVSYDGEAALMKLETDMPAVQLATVFAAKGLEYPIVCCPFLWHVGSRAHRRKGTVAIVRAASETIIDIGSKRFSQHLEQAIDQEDEEQERLLYVALTRARHRVYLGLAPVSSRQSDENGSERSALASLLGLAGVEKEEWLDRVPITRLSPHLRPDLVQPAAPTTLPITLADPPGLALPSGPLTRSSSYSALVRSEDDAPKDYDPDDPNVRTKEPGLLAGLNLTGNRLGQRVHRLLEEVIGNGRDVDVATEHLSPEWKSALGTILQTPIALGTDVTTLEEIRPRAIAEMHVLLPVNSITPVSLSRALLCDPLIAHDQGRRAWAQEIAAWTFGSLAGYFQGYIDLIFEHHGKFYVADYKTNTLPNYGRPALERAMLEHHYLLQARLYTFALHRHLGATLDGYDPATHIGGCLYLFVRGFPKRGVWFERTNVGSLNALDKLFAEASP